MSAMGLLRPFLVLTLWLSLSDIDELGRGVWDPVEVQQGHTSHSEHSQFNLTHHYLFHSIIQTENLIIYDVFQ